MDKRGKSVNIENVEQRAQALCARQEKCSADVRLKLIHWGLPKNDAEVIILKLVRDGFINDTRFAEIFVREKSRFNKWGSIKIALTLRAKGIPDKIINEALIQVEQKTEEESLINLLTKKIKSIKAKSPYELKSKLIRYALSKGYKFDDVLKIATKMVKDDL